MCVQCKTLLKEGFFNKGDALYCKVRALVRALVRVRGCW